MNRPNIKIGVAPLKETKDKISQLLESVPALQVRSNNVLDVLANGLVPTGER